MRGRRRSPLPVVFMNSFRTSDDTLAALAAYPDLAIDGLALGLPAEPGAQAAGRRPDPGRVAGRPDAGVVPARARRHLHRAETPPACWIACSTLGYRYASVSNSDNLGAGAERRASRAGSPPWGPVRGGVLPADRRRPQGRSPGDPQGRPAADLARIRADPGGRDALLHRRVPAPVLQHQQPLVRPRRAASARCRNDGGARAADHPEREDRRPGRLVLPRGDPDRDRDGRGDRGLRGCHRDRVGRYRFLPVKTTTDLLVLRSDAYELEASGLLTKVTDPTPLIDLDDRYYKTIGDFDRRFPAGAPSLSEAATSR